MGRNLPWRKSLILFIFFHLSFTSFSEPLSGENHSGERKSISDYRDYPILDSRNSYKVEKFLDLKNFDKQAVEAQYKRLSERDWEKYLNITFKRFLTYRDFIAQEAVKQNIPYELIYLPIIESAAYSMARSSAGAVGLWQFMPSSSTPYNMITTEWIDERRDFVKSTIGAFSKLNYNYKVTGDWYLAIAAYNCGLNRVTTTVKRTGISDYWELSKKGLLPRETINYVPKLLAVSSLLQEKSRFNLTVKWDRSLWKEIPLNQAIDIRMLSEKAQIPLNILQDGNRELNYSVTPPVTTSYNLKVPVEYADKVASALSGQDNLMEFYRYKVKSGDTLSEIGYYYGISTPVLIRYNPGVTPRTLRVGKTLIVPAVKKVEPYGSDTPVRVFHGNYIVKEGDTLWDISLLFDTTVEEIALNNGLGVDSYIKEGMNLKVP